MKFHGSETPTPENDPLQRDDDGLWDLLGQARSIEVSPFFARNVVRAVRLAPEQRSHRFLSLLFRRWRVAFIGAAVLSVVTVSGLVMLHEADTNALAHYATPDQVANLNEFLAYEPTSGWLDQSPE